MTQSFSGDEKPDSQLTSGSVLVNRYLIQEVIGVGGMGAVYRARDLHFPNVVKLVAIKEMINQAMDAIVRSTIIQNFEREANILALLSHPSIPKIYDYFTHQQRSYLVLEYIQGKDLEALLNDTDGFIPEERVISWAIELCDVLNFLHKHKPEPIVFRDMKPSNVMVTPDNHIVLVDFGIAKNFRAGQKGTMIGTEGYSPPEQYRGEATPLADIYSLGATLHHLLTKQDPRLEPPFTFNDRPIRQLNPSVSVELETVINTALQYNPQDRFPSAEAMKDALIMVARKTGALNRLTKSPTPIVRTDGIKPLWTFKAEDEIRGQACYDNGIIYFGAYDNNLYAVNAENGSFLWKFPTEGGIVTRPLVHEGSVLFGSTDKRLYAISARQGKVNWTYLTEGAIHSSPRIAEGYVFFGSDDGYLYSINVLSNRLLWRMDAGESIRSSPYILGDFVFVGCETGELICVDFRGQVKWRFKTKRPVTSSPLVAEGSVYFASLDSTFYAVDAKTGWAIWRFRMGKGSVSSPFKVNNYLFFGSADGYIYCIETSNAREIWRYQTNHQVSGSPVVYKDSVYCGSIDGCLYCLEFRTGRLRWKFNMGGPITGTPIVYNDILYIGSLDHILYAIGVG
ncbi:MAG TPA: PQQ-binding-like beta-propeller repeat protein [Anaerolineaceae bacterium]